MSLFETKVNSFIKRKRELGAKTIFEEFEIINDSLFENNEEIIDGKNINYNVGYFNHDEEFKFYRQFKVKNCDDNWYKCKRKLPFVKKKLKEFFLEENILKKHNLEDMKTLVFSNGVETYLVKSFIK